MAFTLSSWLSWPSTIWFSNSPCPRSWISFQQDFHSFWYPPPPSSPSPSPSSSFSPSSVASLSPPSSPPPPPPPPELVRLLNFMVLGSTWSALLGFYQGTKVANSQFFIEHLHCLPTTVSGWYRYHQLKHTHVIKCALLHGGKVIQKTVPWLTGFALSEMMLDWVHQKEHVFHPALAGFTASCAYAFYYKLPRVSSLKAMKYATFAGLLQGVLEKSILYYQDLPTKYCLFGTWKPGSSTLSTLSDASTVLQPIPSSPPKLFDEEVEKIEL